MSREIEETKKMTALFATAADDVVDLSRYLQMTS